MARNDITNDSHNPPSNMSTDFEKYMFGELEIDELFWQSNLPGDNIPWRKVNQTQGLNIKAQTTHNFNSNTVVWQKI
tara:strand:+ start:255 stop:485 length:231 start_codon:yes stop_codon:yes gene_type:complete